MFPRVFGRNTIGICNWIITVIGMKAIYINRYQGPEKKKHTLFLKFIVVLIILGGLARIAAPYLITEYINKIGQVEQGLRFKVSDISLKILDSKAQIGNFRVFNADGSVVLMEFTHGLIDVDPIRFLKKENLATQNWKSGEIVLSKYLFEELNKIKNKEKSEKEIYFDSLKTNFDELNIRQVKDESVVTLLSLKDANLKMENVGTGDNKKPTTFDFSSLIREGGSLVMTGKTLLDKENTPWSINGEAKKINENVLEKLSGKALPIEIKAAEINAAITASSNGKSITGIFAPDIKEFKLKEEQGNTLKRTVAKVSNFVLEKLKGKEEEVKFEIPFTLNENFTLNIDDTVKKLVSP